MPNEVEKMEEVQKRISALLNNFKANRVMPRSTVMKYYSGLEITYDEFIRKIEDQILDSVSEEEAAELADQLREF